MYGRFLTIEWAGTGMLVRSGDRESWISRASALRRNQLCERFLDRETLLGSDFLPAARTPRRLRAQWATIQRWDYERILRPVLGPWPLQPEALLYDAVGPLPAFSARRALWHGVLEGKVHPAILDVVTIHPVWGGLGVQRLAEAIENDCIPVVRPETTRIVIGHVPSALECDLLYGLQRAREDGDRRSPVVVGQELLEELPEHVREEVRVEAIVRELRERATRVGVELVLDCTVACFLDGLARGPTGGTMIMVAHQDEHGIHFANGPLELDMLRRHLARLRGRLPWTSFMAMVCDASLELNLAHCMQAAGVPVVMTHGRRTYRGISLGALLTMVRDMEDMDPAPLGRLVDRGVQHLRNWPRAGVSTRDRPMG